MVCMVILDPACVGSDVYCDSHLKILQSFNSALRYTLTP